MNPASQKKLDKAKKKRLRAKKIATLLRLGRPVKPKKPPKRGSLKGRIKKRLPKLCLVLAILIIIGLSAYDFFDLRAGGDEASDMGIVAELAQFLPSDHPSMHVYGELIYLSWRGELQFFDLNRLANDWQWRIAHDLDQPILVGQGAYAVLWQPGVASMYVLTPQGAATLRLLSPPGVATLATEPMLVAVSPVGQLAVLSSHAGGELLQVLDTHRRVLFEQYFADATAIPLALALSETHVAVGFMHIDGAGVSHSVAVFDFELGLVASTGEQAGLVYRLDLSPEGLVAHTTLAQGQRASWLLGFAGTGELVQLQGDPRTIADQLASVVIVQNGRQFVAYDEAQPDEHGNPTELWRFVSLPEPEELRFAGSYDQLVLRTNQRLYRVSR